MIVYVKTTCKPDSPSPHNAVYVAGVFRDFPVGEWEDVHEGLWFRRRGANHEWIEKFEI